VPKGSTVILKMINSPQDRPKAVMTLGRRCARLIAIKMFYPM